MKGLELAERFYLEYGAPMISESFPELEGIIAVGLAGAGSECLGFDDEISRDHDFEPGFCLFIPDEDIIDSRTAFALERAYAKLPKEFMGFKRSVLDPVGGSRHGVIRMSEFFLARTGTADGRLGLEDWFYLPEQSLAEAVGGKVFRDDAGEFSGVRERLSYYPEDVRLKKLAGELVLMGQSGQYNYPRCIARGETGAAQLAVFDFVKSCIGVIFLLNRRYMPYYKWSFRALRELPIQGELCEALEYLISSGNIRGEAEEKTALIEDICAVIARELRSLGLSGAESDALEAHGYEINSGISDGELRNRHILFGAR